MHDYVIRQASAEDIPKVMGFIHDYWNPAHILCQSEDFIKWQHLYQDEFCFVVAENRQNLELEGVLGYIPYSEDRPRDIFAALWKVRDHGAPGLGLKMKLFLMRNVQARGLYSVGLNEATLELHRRSGAVVDELRHYYMLSDRPEFEIAKIRERAPAAYNKERAPYKLEELVSREELLPVLSVEQELGKRPAKSFGFLCRRYIEHPIYAYRLFRILEGDTPRGIYVTRVQRYGNSKALRIVDYLGDVNAIAHTGAALRELVNGGYEYIDFYEYGVEDQILVDAGFVRNPPDSVNVIPNYFEPFVQENIRISMYAHADGPFYIFKGDGDQDRPSRLEGKP